jgi:hypothetical protein
VEGVKTTLHVKAVDLPSLSATLFLFPSLGHGLSQHAVP